MKKLLPVAAVILCLVAFHSCAKDKADKPQSITCAEVNPDSNTYNLKVKAILDVNCNTLGCHDDIFKSLGYDFTTYATSKAAFEGGKARILCAINHQGCSPYPMPKGQPKLADSLIAYLQCWADNGYKQ